MWKHWAWLSFDSSWFGRRGRQFINNAISTLSKHQLTLCHFQSFNLGPETLPELNARPSPRLKALFKWSLNWTRVVKMSNLVISFYGRWARLFPNTPHSTRQHDSWFAAHENSFIKKFSHRNFLLSNIFKHETLVTSWKKSDAIQEKTFREPKISWCNFYNHNNIKHFHLTISTRWNTFFCIYF